MSLLFSKRKEKTALYVQSKFSWYHGQGNRLCTFGSMFMCINIFSSFSSVSMFRNKCFYRDGDCEEVWISRVAS